MEASFEIWLFGHDPLETCACVRVLSHLYKQDANVMHDLNPHTLVSVWHLIKCHSVELYSLSVLSEFEVNVSHVNLQSLIVQNIIYHKVAALFHNRSIDKR